MECTLVYTFFYKEVIMSQRIIEFPEINWSDLKKGALSKDKVWDEIEKAIKFILEVQMLKSTEFLHRDTIENARETEKRLNDLKEEYPQVNGVVQNLLGKRIKEWAESDGNSRTLFSRLRILTIEASFHGCLKEWDEKDLEKVPIGLRKNFEIRLYNPRTKETHYFLPRNWRNETQKRTALILRDLSFKAQSTYRAERGIEPRKRETPVETPKTEEKVVKKTVTKTKPKKPSSKKAKEGDKKAAKQAKVSKAKIRKEEDEVDIRSVKSLADLSELVSKK